MALKRRTAVGRALSLLILGLAAYVVWTRPGFGPQSIAIEMAIVLRVLEKCGFVIERVHISPPENRFPSCEEAILVLRK